MNLQPLNVCMSYVGTLNIVEKISEYHNVEVQFWGDELKERIPKPAVSSCTCVYSDVLVVILVSVYV